MKIPASGIVLLLFAVCAAAQVSSGPEVTVLENKWRTEVYNPALDKDPLSASKDRQRQEEDQKVATQTFPRTIRDGETPATEKGNSRVSMLYVYEAKVRNDGQKEIRTLIWEYVFFKPGTTEEAGRRRFLSKVSIKPGATKHLVERSKASPTGAVEAKKEGRNTREQYSEHVLITKIEYADGSAWSSAKTN